MNKLLFLPLTLVPLLLVGLSLTATTVRAQDDFLNGYYTKVLDTCTPYRLHTHTDFTASGSTITNTCAATLGQMKTACEDQLAHFTACSDPRYTNWLTNDYGTYPRGTWDYMVDQCYKTLQGTQYCPPGGPKTVSP